MTNSRKQHGIGSLAPGEKIVGKPGGLVEPGVKQYGIFKKIKKFGKKVLGSKLGKAALIGGGLYGLGSLAGGAGGWSNFGALGSKVGGWFGKNRLLSGLIRNEKGKLSLGKMGLMGLLGAGVALPFLGDDEEEIVETPWETTPSSIANIHQMARNRDASLSFMPQSAYTQSGFYNAADGGLARLANGGGVAEAQAEQMLKMQYQKYRNQGGTMSYQQFKMTVLKQAQGQGPLAQGQPRMAQPQMAAEGGLMSLGGMEKDYRQEGGFVPLGKEEKADDVPARLSKNEFVFTADAVKAAGGGDIDAGADVMQNVMTNLEEGGEISEESQGGGGEEMISEEEIAEGPDGAQEMYDQQQILQSRMA